MPSKENRTRQVALQDIRANILLAQDFVAKLDYDNFVRDKKTVYAVLRCLEIISEASRRLPEDIRKRHAQIAWGDIASAGNIFRHEYEDIEDLEIWNTLKTDLPPLLLAVEQEISRPEER